MEIDLINPQKLNLIVVFGTAQNAEGNNIQIHFLKLKFNMFDSKTSSIFNSIL